MRILVVLSRVPWPLEKGDKLRAFHLMREWSKTHDVYLFCLTDQSIHPEAEAKLNDICKKVVIHRLSKIQIGLNLFRGLFNALPFQVNYFYSRKAKSQFDRMLDQVVPDHIFCQLARTVEYAKQYSVIEKSLDYMDAFSSGMNKMSQKAPWPLSWLMKLEYQRLREYENKIQDHFDSKFIISEQDRKQLDFVKDLSVVPNGIDPAFDQTPKAIKKSVDILFTGNMSYRPNVESAKLLVNDIMPLIWNVKPDVKLCLCGANPSTTVRNLASNNVMVTGWVDDIVEVYHSSKVFVAPMIVNSGLQNKLLEAMSCQLPCVTTTLANNALGAKPQHEILIGDSPKEIAESILELLDKPQKSEVIGLAGSEYVRNKFSWKGAADLFATSFSAA